MVWMLKKLFASENLLYSIHPLQLAKVSKETVEVCSLYKSICVVHLPFLLEQSSDWNHVIWFWNSCLTEMEFGEMLRVISFKPLHFNIIILWGSIGIMGHIRKYLRSTWHWCLSNECVALNISLMQCVDVEAIGLLCVVLFQRI